MCFAIYLILAKDVRLRISKQSEEDAVKLFVIATIKLRQFKRGNSLSKNMTFIELRNGKLLKFINIMKSCGC